MGFRLLANNCPDGPCPRFWVDDATGDVTVQGYLTDQAPEPLPEGEGFVRIPAGEWTRLVAQLPGSS
jgi:hypothetical protein